MNPKTTPIDLYDYFPGYGSGGVNTDISQLTALLTPVLQIMAFLLIAFTVYYVVALSLRVRILSDTIHTKTDQTLRTIVTGALVAVIALSVAGLLLIVML